MLKITAITLYKHGLGFFERAGAVGADFELTFPRRAMDDVLKSLTVLPADQVTVRGIAFETPDDHNENARRRPISFDAATPLSSIFTAFSGYGIRVEAGDRTVDGRLIGLEREAEDHLKRATVAVSTARGVELIRLETVTAVALTDERAEGDLAFALDEKRRDAERASARVRLSAAGTVAVSYIAPAPAWRVSYRVLIEPAAAAGGARDVVVQGWGLFDNTLEEDLDGVSLTLTAGMPVSFRYELHQPNTPDRPVVRDEERTLSAPLNFDTIAGSNADAMYDGAQYATTAVTASAPRMMKRNNAMSAEALQQSAPTQATGAQRGALFAYTIDAPVSVRRGESGMVPIIAFTARGSRDLIYKSTHHATHPAVSVRFKADAQTLERGPAIILDGGHYGGEAVVPFTTANAEIILAFALELGIVVRSETKQHDETVKLRFKDRSVFIDTITYTTTTYEATSTLAQPESLIIEHPRRYGEEFHTPPSETNLEVGRFRLPLPAHGQATIAVVERVLRATQQDVTGLTGQAVKRYLEGKLLDPATARALGDLLTQEAQAEALETERRTLDTERKAVRMRMDDVRKNIAPLTADTDATLRARFVAQLSAHDQTMQAHDIREAELLEQFATLKVAIDAAARRLST